MIGSRYTPIGVDIGAHSIKAAQLLPTRSGMKLHACAAVTRRADLPQTLTELDRVLARQRFVGRDVVVAAPRDAQTTDLLSLPPEGDDVPISQIARMETARLRDMGPDEFEMAMWSVPTPARGKAQGSTMMVAACPHESAHALLDQIEAADFVVGAMDVEACAAARACAPLAATDTGVCAIVDLGWLSARLIFMHQRTIVYERKLGDAGLSHVHAQLAQRASEDGASYLLQHQGLSQEGAAGDVGAQAKRLLGQLAGAVVEEVDRSVDYLRRLHGEASLTDVFLIGGGAAVPGMVDALRDRLTPGPRAVSPSIALREDRTAHPLGGDARFALALGLALHED